MAKKKITAKTKIKEVTLTAGKEGKAGRLKVKFDKLEFPRGQEDTVKGWLDGKDEVCVSIELDQAKLPGTE